MEHQWPMIYQCKLLKKHHVDVYCKQYIKTVKGKEKSARERRWYDNK